MYSVTAKQVLRILKCDSGEIISMCTPADDNILIVGTTLGTINLYDLSNFDNANAIREDDLDYHGLMKLIHP